MAPQVLRVLARKPRENELTGFRRGRKNTVCFKRRVRGVKHATRADGLEGNARGDNDVSDVVRFGE